MNKRIFIMSIILVVALLFSFVPVVYADETNEESEQIVENVEEEEQEEVEEEQEELKEEKPVVTNEQKVDGTTTQDDATTETTIEEHKVAVITTKVDENDNPLEGAVLQIIDSKGNVVDEWTSTKEPLITT